MRHILRRHTNEEIAGWLYGVREHQRSPSEDCAEKDLQSPIATNVVECAPNRLICLRIGPPFFQRAGKARQGVLHQFWYACRA